MIPLSQFEPGVTVPPFHPHCRGTTCPHIDDKDGERIARNADGEVYHVPANMNYKTWKATFVDGGDKDGLTPATVAQIVRDYDSEFGKKFGKDHYDQIRDRVDACPNPQLQEVWNRYEGKSRLPIPTTTAGHTVGEPISMSGSMGMQKPGNTLPLIPPCSMKAATRLMD